MYGALALEAQAPRVNGRHASMDATRQWTPRVNGRFAPVQAAHAYPARARAHMPPDEMQYFRSHRT